MGPEQEPPQESAQHRGASAGETGQSTRRSAKANRRRVPLVVMASVLVLNLCLATVLYVAFAHSAGGSGAVEDSALYVLPPADAQNVYLGADLTQMGIKSYSFIYSEPGGTPFELTMRPYDTVAVAANDLPATMAVGLPPGSPSLPIDVPALRGSAMTCLGVGSAAMNPPMDLPTGSMLIGQGPMFLTAPMGGIGYRGTSLVVVRVVSNECRLDDAHASMIEHAMRSLRFVSGSEFYAYAATQPKLGSMIIDRTPPPTPVHFDGEELARAQVAEAIAGLDRRLADGTYPNIERGAAPNDYDAMFDSAREASGAMPGATFVATEIWFRSPDEASVTFAITAELPSGRETFSQTGSVVRVDGRWVVARSTVTQMLGRSALPPK